LLVFISYNTSDREKAQAVEAALAVRHPDFEWYLAPRNVAGGAYWIPRLAETIARSDVMLFLAGRQIGNWQELEYYEALRLGRERGGRPRLVPIVTADQAPGLPFFDQLHQLFAADPAAPETLNALDQVLDDSLPPDTSPAWQRFQPYKGLPALEEADAAFFFGRDNETAAILDLMAQRPDRIVALIGQSGVGKSSLARAGVLARLKSQLWPQAADAWPAGLRDSRAFLQLVVRPGEQPLKELARAFAQLYATRTFELDEETAGWARRFADGAGLRDLLRATRDKLAEAAGGEPPKRFVVYVDQGEELYTRANTDESRRFSELVAEAAGHDAFSVLLSLRSDYYPAFQDDRAVFDASEHVDVLRPTRDMVGEVIRRPASTLGARFESGDMAERVAEATEREPGALPLLSDLMHETWLHMQARGDGVLRWSDSPGIVDVAAPLRRRAEAFFADPATDETIIRRLFTLRLAYVPETGDPVRRRARRGECSAAEWAVAEKLADQQWRLLTLARAADGEPVVEVAHEQLLRRWPLLKSWLDDERDFLVWKGQVEHTAASYAALCEAERGEAVLMGRDLAIARDWFEARAADLAPQTRNFVAASLAADTARRDAERRRQRKVQIGTTIALIVAVVLASVAVWKWVEAEDRAKEARLQRERAEHNLALATQTANGLIFDLAQKFQDFGLPAATVQNILSRALKLQDQLAIGGESATDLRRSQGKALIEASNSFRTVGDNVNALTAARQARDIFEALLTADPDNTDDKRHLGTSIDKIGDALMDQGDNTGALAAFRDSLRIDKILTEQHPSNDDWQRALSISYENIGEVLARQGDLDGSLAAFREDLTIAKALAAKSPDNLHFQFDLSESNNKLADVLTEKSDFTSAIAAYRDGLRIREALVQKDSNNLRWQRALAQSHARLGRSLKAQNDLSGALASYRAGFAIMAVLATNDSGNTDMQHDLSSILREMGEVLQARGELDEALAIYQKSVVVRKALIQRDPRNGNWQRQLAVTNDNIGDVLTAKGDPAGALAAYRESLAIEEVLVKKDPGNLQWQDDLIITSTHVGDTLVAAGRHEEALASNVERVKICRGRYAASRSDVSRSDLVDALGSLSFVLLFNRQPADALTAAQEALALDPSAVWIETNHAHALLFLDRFEEAKAIYLANKDKSVGNNRMFKEAVKDDFAEFQKYKIANPRMNEIDVLISR
jgi:tetratricopeptide (TPR) repeat protein